MVRKDWKLAWMNKHFKQEMERKSRLYKEWKRLIRKEDNVSGVRSVETIKEDRSSTEGNPAQTTKNEFATHTSTTYGISL